MRVSTSIFSPEAAPSEPLSVRGYALSSDAIMIDWLEPDYPNGIIRYYMVTYYPTEGFIDGDSEITVNTNSTNIVLEMLNPYTEYTVVLVAVTVFEGNETDPITVRTAEDAPSQPQSIMALPGQTTIQIQWQEPEFPNGVIRYYLVTYFPIDDSNSTNTINATNANTTTLEIGMLSPYTNYTVIVVAVTVAEGEMSNPVLVRTAEAAPSAPVITMAYNTSSTSILIEWNRPSVLNGVLREYLITYFAIDDDDAVRNVSVPPILLDVVTLELSGLEVFTTYSFFVQALTVELGVASNIVNATTDEDVPSEPTNVTVEEINSTSILVSWERPSFPNGVLLYYTVTYRRILNLNESGEPQMLVVNVNTHQLVLTNLDEFTKYEVMVTVSTRIGESAPVFVTIVTDPDSASPPSFSEADTIDSSSIQIMWGYPTEPRGIIQGYVITYRVAESQLEIEVNVTLDVPNDTSNQTLVIDMLTPFTCYVFRVSAYAFSNDAPFQVHLGVDTEETEPVCTDESIPSQPLNFQLDQVELVSSQLAARWMEPRSPNGIILNYTIYCNYSATSLPTVVVPNDTIVTTFIGLMPFTYYECYITANTSVGEGEPSDTVTALTVEDVPSAPTDFTSIVLTAESIYLQWSAPAVSNGIIISYMLTYSGENGDFGTNFYNYVEGEFNETVMSLLPNVIYTFSLKASTSAGFGESISIMTRTLESVPSQPLNFQLDQVELDSSQLTARWMEPRSPNGIILNYTIYCNDSATSLPTVVVSGDATMTTLTGLMPFTYYECYITANTSVGEGEPSDTVTALTVEDVPSAPTNFTSIVLTAESIYLQWSAPSVPNGIIIGYMLTYSGENGDFGTENYTAGEFDDTLTNLFPYVIYNVSLKASTSAGFGESSSIMTRTLETVPSRPLNFQLDQVELDSSQLTARWMEPRSPNGIIVLYSIYCNDSATSLPTVVVSGDATMTTLTGLMPFTYYECYITANTSVGEGVASNDILALTVEDIPSAPTDFTLIVLSAESIFLQWSAPAVPNGIIIGYVLTYSGENGDFGTENYTAAEFNDTLTSLSPNVVYNLSLISSTNAGFGESISIAMRTFETAPDEPPQNITVTNITSTTLIITWQPPSSESRNGVIQSYIIIYSIQGDTSSILETNSTDTTVQLTGLEIFTVYEVNVSAVTVAEGPSATLLVQTDSDLPSPPQTVTYRNISSMSVNISWLPPVMSNGVIENYTLQYFRHLPLQPPITITGINSTMYLLGGLHPYTTYSVVIMALTDKGAGPASETLIVFTQEDRPESPPENLTTISVSATEVLLSWSEPVTPNGIIIGYNLHYSNESYNTSESVGPTSIPYIVSGLNEFTNYTFILAAVTSVGSGPAASLVVATEEAAPSAPPTNIQGTNVSSTSLFVSWSEPPVMDQNGIIRHYSVEYRVQGRRIQTLVTLSNSITLSDLEIYTLYQVLVSAVTVEEGPSVSILIQTDSDLPAAPRVVQGVDITPTSVNVSWLPPVPANGVIEFYSLEYSSLVDGNMSVLNIPDSPYVLTGLMEHVNYTIVVYAHTDKGQGEGSQPIIIQTEEELPDVPSNFRAVDINSTSLTVSWEPPADPNGIVTSYHLFISIDPRDAEYFDSDIQTEIEVAADNRVYTLEGLHPFIEYHLQLSARTSAGMGNRTSVLSLTTVPDAPSAGVRDVEVQANGLNSVTVSWLPPSLSNWNGEITSYFITWSLVSECDDQEDPVNRTDFMDSTLLTSFFNPTHPRDVDVLVRETVQVTGLQESTNYTFTISVMTSGDRNSPEIDVLGCNSTDIAIAPFISLKLPSDDNIEVVVYETLNLSVVIENFNQPINIVWKLNDGVLYNGYIHNTNLDEPPAVSTYSKRLSSDYLYQSGTYEVVVSNSAGTVRAFFNVNVTVPVSIGDPYAFHSPVIAREGDSVTFSCTASGIPPPYFTWLDGNNNTISAETEERIRIYMSGPHNYGFYNQYMNIYISTLEILSSRRTDTGNEYTCVASNIIRNETANERRVFSLTVTYPPTVEVADNLGVHQVGVETRDGVSGTVSLSFIIQDSYPAVHEDDIIWIYVNATSGETLYGSSTIEYLLGSGAYSGGGSGTNGGILDVMDERFSITTEHGIHTLSIRSLQFSDSGVYSLTASNGIGSDTASINLTVHVEPILLSMTVLDEMDTFDEGQLMSFSCTADGFPPPIIVWLHNGTLIDTNLQQRFSTNIDLVDSNRRPHVPQATTSTLLVRDLHLRDSGEYICRADPPVTGQSDVAMTPIILRVEAQPIDHCVGMPCMNDGTCVNLEDGFLCECIEDKWRGVMCETVVIKDEPAKVVLGPKHSFSKLFKPVNLTCDVTGSPQPEITWYKDDELLEGQRLSYLFIDEVELSDRGMYFCVASNTIQDPENPSHQDQSDPAVLNIEGIVQYFSALRFAQEQFRRKRQTDALQNMLSLLSAHLSGVNISGSDATVYSVTTTSQNEMDSEAVPLLITLLSPNGGDSVLLEKLKETLDSVAMVEDLARLNVSFDSIQRFDGCPADTTVLPALSDDGTPVILDWPEVDLGVNYTLQCPCGNLSAIGGDVNRKAYRFCGGDFTTGATWSPAIQQACNFSEVTRKLCQISNLIEEPKEAIITLETITDNEDNIGALEVGITAVLLDSLSDAVVMEQNISLTENLLAVVDNILDVEGDQLQQSQEESNSSAMILDILGRVAESVPIPENETEVIIPLRSFAVSVREIEPESFTGLTFSALLGDSFDFSQNDENIDANSLVFDEQETQPTASISIPEDIFGRASSPNMNTTTPRRIIHSVYLTDSLFGRREESEFQVGSIVISAAISGGVKVEGLENPIMMQFIKSPDVVNGTETMCNFWDTQADDGFGNWSGRGCWVVNETEEDVTCACNHLTNFAILLDVSPDNTTQLPDDLAKTLLAVSYIGAILSIILLTLTIITYLSAKKLRSSVAGQLLINLCLALIGIYVMFIVAYHSTGVKPLCAVAGGLLHYFMLVTFAIMAAEAVNVYIKLVLVFGHNSIQHRYVLKTVLICWIVPLVIVVVSLGPNYRNYIGEQICRPYNLPFYVGLIAPFLAVYVFNWIMFLIIFISLLKRQFQRKEVKMSTSKKDNTKADKAKQQFVIAVTLSLLFGLGWGFGLPATNSISSVPLRAVLQAIFIFLSGFQGVFVFIMQCLKSQEARKEWKKWFNFITCRPDRARAYSKSTASRGYSGDNTLPRRYNKNATMSTSNTPWNSDTMRRAVHFDTLKRPVDNEKKKEPAVVFVNEGFEEKKDLSLDCSKTKPDELCTVVENENLMEMLAPEEDIVDAGGTNSEESEVQEAKPLVTNFAEYTKEDSSFQIMWVDPKTGSILNEQTTNESCEPPSQAQHIELQSYTDGVDSSLVVANTNTQEHSQSVMDGKDEQVEMVDFLVNESLSSTISNVTVYLQAKNN